MHAKTFQRVLYIYLCIVSFCDAKQDRFCGASEFVQYTFKSPPVRPPAREILLSFPMYIGTVPESSSTK